LYVWQPTPLQREPPDAAAGFIVFMLFLVFGVVVYCAPSMIAAYRNHPNLGPIILVNLLLGWTCGIGWIVALVWSLSAIDTSRTYR